MNGQPLSAIDWLTDSVAIPPSADPNVLAPVDEQIREEINVRPIGAPSADGIGLVDASAFGLPADMWEPSDPTTLARLMVSVTPTASSRRWASTVRCTTVA